MQATDLQALLKDCPYPITWHHFQSEQQLPFAVWKEDESENVTSDLSMLRLRDMFTIDFYYQSWNQKKVLRRISLLLAASLAKKYIGCLDIF